MVVKEDLPRCGKCNNGAPCIEDGYTLCHLKYLKVWSNSIACSDYDDSEVY